MPATMFALWLWIIGLLAQAVPIAADFSKLSKRQTPQPSSPTSGPLYNGNGPSADDVVQWMPTTCFMLAPLQRFLEVDMTRDWLRDGIDNIKTDVSGMAREVDVTLPNGGNPKRVTVDYATAISFTDSIKPGTPWWIGAYEVAIVKTLRANPATASHIGANVLTSDRMPTNVKVNPKPWGGRIKDVLPLLSPPGYIIDVVDIKGDLAKLSAVEDMLKNAPDYPTLFGTGAPPDPKNLGQGSASLSAGASGVSAIPSGAGPVSSGAGGVSGVSPTSMSADPKAVAAAFKSLDITVPSLIARSASTASPTSLSEDGLNGGASSDLLSAMAGISSAAQPEASSDPDWSLSGGCYDPDEEDEILKRAPTTNPYPLAAEWVKYRISMKHVTSARSLSSTGILEYRDQNKKNNPSIIQRDLKMQIRFMAKMWQLRPAHVQTTTTTSTATSQPTPTPSCYNVPATTNSGSTTVETSTTTLERRQAAPAACPTSGSTPCGIPGVPACPPVMPPGWFIPPPTCGVPPLPPCPAQCLFPSCVIPIFPFGRDDDDKPTTTPRGEAITATTPPISTTTKPAKDQVITTKTKPEDKVTTTTTQPGNKVTTTTKPTEDEVATTTANDKVTSTTTPITTTQPDDKVTTTAPITTNTTTTTTTQPDGKVTTTTPITTNTTTATTTQPDDKVTTTTPITTNTTAATTTQPEDKVTTAPITANITTTTTPIASNTTATSTKPEDKVTTTIPIAANITTTTPFATFTTTNITKATNTPTMTNILTNTTTPLTTFSQTTSVQPEGGVTSTAQPGTSDTRTPEPTLNPDAEANNTTPWREAGEDKPLGKMSPVNNKALV